MKSAYRMVPFFGALMAAQVFFNYAQAGCTLNFTSPQDGATVTSSGITIYGQGGADAQHGDSGTVTATLNGASFFNYSGSFTAAVSFLQSRGVAITLREGLNFLAVSGSVGGCSRSDTMTILYDPEVNLGANKGKPETLSCDTPSTAQGNPINAAIGNKFQQEEDFRGGGPYPLHFSRHYNSVDGYWRHSYSTRLRISSSLVTLIHADGRESAFAISGSTITPGPSELGALEQLSSGWQYTSAEQEVFEFDGQGRLLRTTNANGQYHQLTYGANDDVEVEDTFGNQLSFTQDERHQPLSLSTANLSFTYNYDATARLTSVETLANGQTFERQFHYENTSYPRFLTGITDERNVRFVTWEYDALGRATKSVYADGANETNISYNTDGSTTVTNALGRETHYSYSTINGVKRITAIDGEPAPNCPASNSSYSYDSRGLLASKTNERGIVTTYQYNAQGLEISRTEASGTPEERTITTQWHATLHLPILINEPQRKIEMTYDANGRLLNRAISPQP